uniref:RAP domain-containing protein n=1 Tax=Chromera velia CCMP2878 TaxID=1169474 RepID=A0A0G4HBP0_9ALVE|eukprot:Cvel_25898.t1-p1 / transcript=Cvel_25898.t1 / gene=Cvel_25898 / organism=Chromera_velia_CCMP2878 / gene_product=hypothetical protein / transcript_product=hypothetical protein / location=Cvel_scaffold2992:3265-11935(-) / protein_length=663 / sequence_SO=supercontig / SO=protein_coding / is_pseudo=false
MMMRFRPAAHALQGIHSLSWEGRRRRPFSVAAVGDGKSLSGVDGEHGASKFPFSREALILLAKEVAGCAEKLPDSPLAERWWNVCKSAEEHAESLPPNILVALVDAFCTVKLSRQQKVERGAERAVVFALRDSLLSSLRQSPSSSSSSSQPAKEPSEVQGEEAGGRKRNKQAGAQTEAAEGGSLSPRDSVALCLSLLKAIRHLSVKEGGRRRVGSSDRSGQGLFEDAMGASSGLLIHMTSRELTELLTHTSSLALYGFESRRTFLVALQLIRERLDVRSERPSPFDVARLFKAFSKAGVQTEMLRVLTDLIITDLGLPHCPCTPQMASHLLFTCLSTRNYSPPLVERLLAIVSREHIGLRGESSVELRSLKWVEISLRLDFAQTVSSLSPEAQKLLGLVRDLRYVDPGLEEDTRLSRQLSFFLKKHGFPCSREMEGPYGLKICDRENRIAFECLEKEAFYPNSKKLRFTTETKIRHLEALGWKVFPMKYWAWDALTCYEVKAAFVRKILKRAGLIEGVRRDAPSRLKLSGLGGRCEALESSRESETLIEEGRGERGEGGGHVVSRAVDDVEAFDGVPVGGREGESVPDGDADAEINAESESAPVFQRDPRAEGRSGGVMGEVSRENPQGSTVSVEEGTETDPLHQVHAQRERPIEATAVSPPP